MKFLITFDGGELLYLVYSVIYLLKYISIVEILSNNEVGKCGGLKRIKNIQSYIEKLKT